MAKPLRLCACHLEVLGSSTTVRHFVFILWHEHLPPLADLDNVGDLCYRASIHWFIYCSLLIKNWNAKAWHTMVTVEKALVKSSIYLKTMIQNASHMNDVKRVSDRETLPCGTISLVTYPPLPWSERIMRKFVDQPRILTYEHKISNLCARHILLQILN